MMKMEKSGQILCDACGKTIVGETLVSYKYEDDFVDEIITVHNTNKCVKLYRAKRNNLNFECPVCNGEGYKILDSLCLLTSPDGKFELVKKSSVVDFLERYRDKTLENLKEVRENCELCFAKGYLAKQPVPVVTSWKRS